MGIFFYISPSILSLRFWLGAMLAFHLFCHLVPSSVKIKCTNVFGQPSSFVFQVPYYCPSCLLLQPWWTFYCSSDMPGILKPWDLCSVFIWLKWLLLILPNGSICHLLRSHHLSKFWSEYYNYNPFPCPACLTHSPCLFVYLLKSIIFQRWYILFLVVFLFHISLHHNNP